MASASFLAFALSAQGYPVHHADLNDGGVWVTNDIEGLFGRINGPINQLDAGFYPPGSTQSGYQLDVLQDAAAVAAWDKGAGVLVPVNVTTVTAPEDAKVRVPATDQVGLGGGSLAVLDPATGRLWATRVDPDTGIANLAAVDSAAKELAVAGGHAALAVGQDGTVYAASADARILITLHPTDAGFDKPTSRQIEVTGQSLQVTSVGAAPVIFDPQDQAVILPSGKSASLPDSAGGQLQQPGPAADAVLVATTSALIAVPLGGGHPTTLIQGVSGQPIAPVRLGTCVHSVWHATPAVYGRSCDGTASQPQTFADGAQSAASLTFRVNRGQIRLNNRQTGAVWTVDDKVQQIADWAAIKPPPRLQDNKKKNNQARIDQTRTRPPKAVDDDLGARPGRTTVLHVLDNDSDPSGNILAIASFTQPDGATASLQPAPDGQTIEITLPAQTDSEVRFRYTIDDGKGQTATAQVTVHPHQAGQNGPPVLRPGFLPKNWPVAASAQVTIPVAGDWRDPDGDPVLLTSATVADGAGSVGTTPDGRVIYNAPPTGGAQRISYAISDGAGGQVQSSVAVTVQDPKSSIVVPPKAQPDVVLATVGRPVTVHPLDNDEPGADPTSDSPQLGLGSKLAQPAGTAVQTDLATGAVTVTGLRAGTVLLTYVVTYGAGSAKGTIRVNIDAAPASPKPPVAGPDTAVLHGQQPAIVDVLANDYDPSGGVLVVQHAAATGGPNSGLRAAIIEGHWLRIDATNAAIKSGGLPQLVRYTVSDGSGTATGEVSVTQLPPPAKNSRPVPQDDRADVRAGDAVTIPVLANDLDPDGDALTLAPRGVEVAGGPGQGAAYVSGNAVRYAAPLGLRDLTPVVVTYLVQDPAGATATGRITVTVHPATEKNQPPSPLPVTANVVAGDTVIVKPQTTGVDPNGDSVAVTGLAASPTLGRILSVSAVSLSYQAFPTSSNTDEFSYQVMDRFGATGIATVRIGVLPPSDPQPPVAVDDTMTASPGARLAVDVEANDFISGGDEAATKLTLTGAPAGVTVSDSTISLTAPPANGVPVVVPYSLSDGLATSTATLTVHGLGGFDNPPMARDDDARPTGPTATSATVDVLANDDDPDGPRAALRVVAAGPGGMVTGGKVAVSLQPHPQSIWYEVKDGQGAAAMAVIHAPAAGGGLPYVKANALIHVDKGKSVTVAVANYLTDPAGKPLRLGLAKDIWAAPAAGLQVHNQGDTQLVLTGRGDYVGPAAVTFAVTDGTTLSDPTGQHAIVTIPVQVGPDTPVLRCPTSAFAVFEGGPPLNIPLPSVCHVWTPTSMQPSDVRFTAQWASQPAGVTEVLHGQTLAVQAVGAAQAGTGAVAVGVAGSNQRELLTVQVVKPPLATVRPIVVDGIKAGESRAIEVAPYFSSPILSAAPTVIRAARTGGMDVAVSVHGSAVTVQPGRDARGEITVALTLTDVPGRPDRQITGQLTLRVLGYPATIGQPTADANRSLGHQVEVSWPAPDYDGGAPIDQYRVSWSGGTHSCAGSPCTVPGLANGTAYRFTVAAHNIAGFWSLAESPQSNPATPDAKPGAVTGLTVGNPVGDQKLVLSWAANVPDGSPADQYQVEIDDVGSTSPGTRLATVPGSQDSYTVTGLTNNDPYRFRVRAHNADGWGPYSGSVPGQSAGVPAAMAAPEVPAEQSTSPSDNTVAGVSWQPEQDPNGPSTSYYSVYRKAGSGDSYARLSGCAQVSANAALTCSDTVQNNGTTYYYAITATNGAGIESVPTNGTPFVATGIPDQVSSVSAAASANPGPGPQTDTGASFGDGTIHVTFTMPQPHGAQLTKVEYAFNGASTAAGSWPSPGGPGQSVTEPIGGLSNGSGYSVSVRGCNEGNGNGDNCGGWSSASNTVYPYGSPPTPTAGASNNGTVVTYSWGGGTNGRPVHFFVSIDGGSYADRGTAGNNEQDDRGYSHTYSISVYVRDSAGQQSPTASASGTTPAPPPSPPPSASISASQGAPGYSSIGTCTSSSSGCNWLSFQVHNFAIGRYTWTCISNGQVSYQSTATINITDPNQSFAGGSGNNGYCVFGRGISEQIRINGITSNSVPHNP